MNDGTLRTERVDTIMGAAAIKNLKAILFYAGTWPSACRRFSSSPG
jgi:hypothetical protein